MPRIKISAVSAERATVHVVEIEGPLELATVPALRRELTRLAERGATRLLLDLTHVDFIDLAGVATLYRAGLAARTIAIVALPDSQPARTVALCQLDGMVPAFADRAEALASLAQARPVPRTLPGRLGRVRRGA